jgi:hypothetical protein
MILFYTGAKVVKNPFPTKTVTGRGSGAGSGGFAGFDFSSYI